MIEFKINWRKSIKEDDGGSCSRLGSFDGLDILSSCLLIHSLHSLENMLVIAHKCSSMGMSNAELVTKISGSSVGHS